MPTKQLSGTVEEQAAQLYDMAVEAMEEGRYTAAYRYFKEINRALPGFRDVPEKLAQASYAKREQRTLLWASLLGAIVFIILARLLGAQSEWVLLGSAAAGLAVGFVLAHWLYPRLAQRPGPTNEKYG